MTFSQKLYQSHALVIAEEYEQAIEANSLEQIKNLLDKVLERDGTRSGRRPFRSKQTKNNVKPEIEKGLL